MVANDTLMNFGFIKDENNLKLKELLKENVELKELHVDVYPDNPLKTAQSPFMLLLRMIEKNVIVESDDNRIIFKKHDKWDTCLSNVLFSKIKECFFKTSDTYSEFIVNIQNIYYRIIVFK
jgi:hypothetical protein